MGRCNSSAQCRILRRKDKELNKVVISGLIDDERRAVAAVVVGLVSLHRRMIVRGVKGRGGRRRVCPSAGGGGGASLTKGAALRCPMIRHC